MGLPRLCDLGGAAVREGSVEVGLDVELLFQPFLRLRPPKFLYIIILFHLLSPQPLLRAPRETIGRRQLDYLIHHRHIILLLFYQPPRADLVKLVDGARVDVLGALRIALRP